MLLFSGAKVSIIMLLKAQHAVFAPYPPVSGNKKLPQLYWIIQIK